MGTHFFSDKINLKTVSELFIFPRYTRHFAAKRDFVHQHLLIYKQPTEYISKRASQQAEGELLLNSEMPKKKLCLPKYE